MADNCGRTNYGDDQKIERLICKARFPFKRNARNSRALRKRKTQETQALDLDSS